MTSAAQIRDLLPSLWRPEPDAADLLSALVQVSGQGLDRARIEAGNTMQSHWARFADSALLSPYVAAFRAADGSAPLLPGDPDVRTHPYLDDLARLAGLLGLTPYAEPLDGRETVEEFRDRVAGTVALWKSGITTRHALREAARLALSGMPERGLGIEEFAPGAAMAQIASTAGPPTDLVGPLMRWTVNSASLTPVAPEVFIHGQAPVSGKIDATETPLIERFDPATGTGTGVVYGGTVEPGQVLALLPSYSSWLGGDGGLRSATALPGESPANPTAPGPWVAPAGAPTDPVHALALAADGALYAAVQAPGGAELWRLSATGWAAIASGLPPLHCLLPQGQDLLIGHANGLSRLAVFAAAPALTPDPAAGTGPAVNGLARAADGTIWAATGTGAARVDAGDVLTAIGPGALAATETPLAAVLADPDGVLLFGGAAGLFRFDTVAGRWHIYRGEALDETVPDWVPWDPGSDALPADAEVFLPAVTALARGPEGMLWIGTEAGLANYAARRQRGTYATRLLAFPALGAGPVHTLVFDERQRLWIGAERGLAVHDGLDWYSGNGGLTRLPRAAADSPDTHWRYNRAGSVWQSARGGPGKGFVPQTPDAVTPDNGPVRAICWTDGCVARLGTMTGTAFTEDTGAVPADLQLRIKPEATRIVQGGLPALPRLPPGTSDWRYLTLEEAAPPAPTGFPAWTREGRLLPPPDQDAAPGEGRFLAAAAIAALDHVYAFNPAARVSFQWQPHAPLSITVRLERQTPDETLPPAVLDRVFAAMDRVRPAGARIRLAHGETIVRGDQNG